MNAIKELIILHIQEKYMNDITVPHVRQTALKTINNLVAKTKDTGKVNFWLDFIKEAGKSSITIDNKNPNVKTFEAPAGDVSNDYKLSSNTVTLTGLWIGACVNNAVLSLVRSYVENKTLVAQGKLTINLESKAICKPNKLLEEMSPFAILGTFYSPFENDPGKTILENIDIIKERGLVVSMIRNHPNPSMRISETRTVIKPTNTSGTMLLVVANIV